MRTRSPDAKPEPVRVTTEPTAPLSGFASIRGFADTLGAGSWAGRDWTGCPAGGDPVLDRDGAVADGWVEAAAAGPGCAAGLPLSPTATAVMTAATMVATAVTIAPITAPLFIPPLGVGGGGPGAGVGPGGGAGAGGGDTEGRGAWAGGGGTAPGEGPAPPGSDTVQPPEAVV